MLPTTFLAILLSTSQLGLIQDTFSGRWRIAEVYTLQRVVLTGTLKGISLCGVLCIVSIWLLVLMHLASLAITFCKAFTQLPNMFIVNIHHRLSAPELDGPAIFSSNFCSFEFVFVYIFK